MQKAKLSWLFILNVFLLITAVVSLVRPNIAQSAMASHLVISEIQIAGGAATNDFVELYNPTDTAIELDDFRLVKRTATGSADTSIVSFAADDVIPAHGFFLWCNTVIAGVLGCDSSNGGTVANNNSVALRLGAEDTGAVIDAVGIGAVNNGLIEGTPLTAPDANSSVERKANSASTVGSMLAADAALGSGEDTDNNANDFLTRAASEPQNSSASAEIPGAGPSPSASVTPAASPSTSPSASPSASPSLSPSPSASASASPSVSPSASPSASPTATSSPSVNPSPSMSPSPSLSPSPSASASGSPSTSPSATPTMSPSISPSTSPNASASASVAPSQTPRPSVTPKPKKTLVCEFKPQTFNFGWFKITLKVLDCDWVLR